MPVHDVVRKLSDQGIPQATVELQRAPVEGRDAEEEVSAASEAPLRKGHQSRADAAAPLARRNAERCDVRRSGQPIRVKQDEAYATAALTSDKKFHADPPQRSTRFFQPSSQGNPGLA